MAYRDQRHDQQDAWHEHNRSQMGQYADNQRQFGSDQGGDHRQDARHDARNWGARHEGSDLTRHDPAQASYGRASAPDVRGAPSGGYQRDWQADPGYNTPGYMRNPDERPGYRSQGYGQGGPNYDEGRDWNRAYGSDEDRYGHGQQRYQGGVGGPRSNDGPYAGSQTYGGYGDQLGYGSYQDGGRQQGQQHHDPDYRQWREQQLRSLDDDYQSWRGERYKKFSDEFDSWRKNRQGTEQKNDLPGSTGSAGRNTGSSGTK